LQIGPTSWEPWRSSFVEARAVWTLDRPAIDFVGMAKSLGMPGVQVLDLEQLTGQLERAMAERGPYLIEVVM
jgi:thiamine pyrophosphate-dependent acetolactate synthase large subunit-like protein